MTKEMLEAINKVGFKLYDEGDRIVDVYESEYGITIVKISENHVIYEYFYCEIDGTYSEPLVKVL